MPIPDLTLKTEKIDLMIQMYERYLPTAFDESLTILEKVNKITYYLQSIGVGVDLVDKWNLLVEWIKNEGLKEAIEELLKEMDLGGSTDYQVVTITKPEDITADVKLAYDKLKVKGGGTLFIPYGDWVMHDYLEITSNVTVTAPKGTTIRKNMASISAYTFLAGKTIGTSGYGGGGKNIVIENITFRGFPQDATIYYANGLAFNHVDNLTVRDCSFIDAIYGGHAIDLAGCSNVEIYNNVFAGQELIAGREYAEAIQIDSSTPASIGDWAGVDGLPTIKVNVHHNDFIPSGPRLAPNPIGNHGFTGGKPYSDITFSDNYVEDAQAYSAGGWRGWVHFYATQNLKINRNHFKNTKSLQANVVQLLTSSGGRYDPVTLIAGTGAPVEIKHVEVSGNIFEGFNNSIPNTIIRGYGTTYESIEYNVVDINVSDNQFINCGAASMVYDESNGLINIYHAIDVIVKGNRADSGRYIGSIWDVRNLIFSNNIGKNLSNCMLYSADSYNVTISNNIGDNLKRPIELEEVTGLICGGNQFYNVLQVNTDTYANKFRNITNGQVFNNFTHTAGGIDYANYFYVGTTIIQFANVNNIYNLSQGFTTRTNNTSGSASFVNYTAVGQA